MIIDRIGIISSLVCISGFSANRRCNMEAVTGIFSSRDKAEQALRSLHANGVSEDRVTLLAPHADETQFESIPIDSTEQPGIGTAIGTIAGGAAGLSGGLAVAMLPGVGPVAALGLLGAAVLTAAGASAGAMAGRSLENFLSQGLPEDEIFVYEDALRKGDSVVVALARDEDEAKPFRKLLRLEGAESVDAAREQWWIGLRSAEQEHYSATGRGFGDDEKFYRLGFEAALHARNRCKEFDQISAEMESNLEDLQRQYPGVEVAEPYSRGFQRGREHYQHLCEGSKAA
jgi:hypothetical protein